MLEGLNSPSKICIWLSEKSHFTFYKSRYSFVDITSMFRFVAVHLDFIIVLLKQVSQTSRATYYEYLFGKINHLQMITVKQNNFHHSSE